MAFAPDVSPPCRVASLQVQYVPRALLLALRSGGAPAADVTSSHTDEPSLDALRSLLGSQDLTRLLTLTAQPQEATVAPASGGSGERPYDAAAGELVALFAACIDALPPLLGADVLQRMPDGSLRTQGLGPDEE